ncbi:hypothetical protein ACWGJ2_05810 [Streptomyces sp. NPDC054796]
MKVRMIITLDLDADAWATEYGVSREEVRADVKSYIATALQDCHLSLDQLVREVTWK